MKPVLCDYCKRERVNQNDTNWNRHIESCKKKTQMCNKRQKGNLDRFFNKKQKSCIGMYKKTITKLLKCILYLLYFNKL